MFGRRKARDGVKADEEEAEAKPLTLQERLNLLETGEVLLEYPAGLAQPFSRQELGRLKRRFVQLLPAEDTSRELRLSLAAVLQMPELRAQPFTLLVARLILGRQATNPTLKDIEDRDRELVSFGAFLTVLAVFSVKQTLELKRRVLFDIYDQEGKGCATVDDFLRVISTVSRSNATKQKTLRHELELHVAPFIKQTKSNVSGVLFDDFNQLVVDQEVISALTIAY